MSKWSRTPIVQKENFNAKFGQYSCSKKYFEERDVFDVALLGLLAAVLGLASKLMLRAVLGVLTC